MNLQSYIHRKVYEYPKIDIYQKSWYDKTYRYIISTTRFKTLREAVASAEYNVRTLPGVDPAKITCKFKACFSVHKKRNCNAIT